VLRHDSFAPFPIAGAQYSRRVFTVCIQFRAFFDSGYYRTGVPVIGHSFRAVIAMRYNYRESLVVLRSARADCPIISELAIELARPFSVTLAREFYGRD